MDTMDDIADMFPLKASDKDRLHAVCDFRKAAKQEFEKVQNPKPRRGR